MLLESCIMGNILKSGKEEDPDSAWQAQNKEMERNPAYKFADLNKGGKLIEAYRRTGVVAVQEIARNEIQPYLYNGGKGGVITKLDYVKWTRRTQAMRTVRSVPHDNLGTLPLSHSALVAYDKPPECCGLVVECLSQAPEVVG